MTLKHKRAHLDENNVIRFGRYEIGIALVTMLIAVSTLVGNFYIGNERSERNAKAIGELTVQVGILTTSQAVTATNVSHNTAEINEIKADIKEDRK